MPRHPINFVHHDLGRWDDLRNVQSPPLPHELPNRFTEGWDCWTVQPYLHLKRRGWDVRLSFGLQHDAINVMHADTFLMRGADRQAFSFVIRADRPPVLGADVLAVQNPVLACPGRRIVPVHYLPLFPEPGLIPRDPARGGRLERIAYMGRLRHLAGAFQSREFRGELEQLGVSLEIRERNWWDYRDVDAVLAIRTASREVLLTKPATKLYNAWLAGCIPLLGEEPAYAALRRSELDYIPIASPQDVLDAIRRLRREPDRAAAMRENAVRRGGEFTTEKIVERWEELLEGPVAERYEAWRARGPVRSFFRRVRLSAAARRRRSVWDAWDLRNGHIPLEQVRGRWSLSYLRGRFLPLPPVATGGSAAGPEATGGPA